ncbi:LAFA_0D14554g1_1 [Lachancea sp. 'fantastica']|nr:LAFA_0D14554g1_1 [Lachancea sp. 'fantastica']
MWVLRFECKGADGTQIKVSCCLKQAIQYDIGRSTKSPLNIKNDKSISRSHIKLETDAQNLLSVSNLGKLTKINGKAVKVGHTAKFSPTSETIIEMGAEPIVAIVTYENALWKLPHDTSMAESDKQQLSLYGIDAVTTLSSNTTIQIVKQREGHYGNCLFALVSGIPVLRETIISDFFQQVDHIHTNFDERWTELVKRNSQFPNYVPTPSIFRTFNFVVTSRKVFAIFKHIVDAGNGTLWLCDGVTNLESFVRNQVQSDKIVILMHLNNTNSSLLQKDDSNGVDEIQEARLLRAEAKKIGLAVFDVNDLVNAVLNHDLSSLLKRTPVQRTTPTAASSVQTINSALEQGDMVSQDTANSSLRKRRPNRQRVQPLNSLTFFGGGGSIASQEIKAKSEQPPISEDVNFENDPVVEEAAVQPAFKKPRLGSDHETRKLIHTPLGNEDPRFLKRPHDNIEDDDEQPSVVSKRDKIDSPAGDPSPSVASSSELKHGENILVKKSRIGQDAAANSPPASSREGSTPGMHSINLRNGTRSGSFVRAIQETKTIEVDRLKERMADVQGEELTEEAIMQLDNLAIVETTDLLRKRNNGQPAPPTNSNEPWNGRKNFKKFVKIWPSRSSNSSPDSANDAIRNKAYMITRDYVPMQQFDPRKSSLPEENMTSDARHNEIVDPIASENGIDFGVQVEDDEPVFQFTSQRTGTHAAHTSSETPYSENQQELFIIDEDDSQQRFNDKQLFHKDTAEEDIGSIRNASDKTSYLSKNNRGQRGGNVNNDEESDDSDDEPKFQFRSRKR